MAKPYDVTDADFDERVLRRSFEMPVLVDFWADWCQPCHMLAPVLERAVDAHDGKVELAKLDVDSNQATAARYGVRGLPTVKAFRDGRVATEFTGAQPPQMVARFVDSLVPSEADALVGKGDEASLRRALDLEPGHPVARRELGRLLLRRGETEEALELLEGAPADFVAAGLAARARLADDAELAPAFEAWDEDDHARALELLQEALADPERRDRVRRVMVAIFTELGPEHPLAREHRRRLSAALN
ncbi:MAG TPA: tetratricopeptide repeat protein [Thermoleophilaceae bacterium]|nr:tetratricopeptide repeat protein [Thermoleophilaceae bacterium]